MLIVRHVFLIPLLLACQAAASADAASLAAEVARLEKMLHREVSYTTLKPQELKRKLAAHDPFLTDIWQGKRIELIGHEQNEATAD